MKEDFFKNYLFQLNKFFKCINDTFLKDLSIYNFNSKENQKVFEYFIFYISNYDFENLDLEIKLVWEDSFKELNYEDKMNILDKYNTKKIK